MSNTGPKEYRKLHEIFGFKNYFKSGNNPLPESGNLRVTQTHRGGFYKAFLNGERISKWSLFDLMGMEGFSGRTLEWHVAAFGLRNIGWDVDCDEMDVS